MIDYILKSGICLTLLLAIYHLFLEREKMHQFNRFFLLFSLAFGLIIPLLTIEISSNTVPFASPLSNTFVDQIAISAQTDQYTSVDNSSNPSFDFQDFFIFLYGLVTGIFLTRFGGNLFRIFSSISKSPHQTIERASIVLLSKDILPHSFMNYIFLNEEDYKNDKIEEQLLEHELTHVRQRHSLDILFVEVLKIIFWFNPIFILYKKAIQLNHEFLADEAVGKSYDISSYQYLLLEKSVSKGTIELASNLNYSVTKRRLNMMIKTTSRLRIWIAKLAVVPVMIVILFVFSTKVVSEAIPELKSKILSEISATRKYSDKEIYFKGSTIWTKAKNGLWESKKYDEMSAAERTALPVPPAARLTPKRMPTKEMLEKWKEAPSVYGVWLDGKRINNVALSGYKPDDFGLYSYSRLTKNAINYGKHYFQIDLYTNQAYNGILQEAIKRWEKPGKGLLEYNGKIGEPGFATFYDIIPDEKAREGFVTYLLSNKEMCKSLGIGVVKKVDTKKGSMTFLVPSGF